MDQFAPTGPQTSDLFDDYEESMQTRANDDLFADEFDPVEAQSEPEAKPAPVAAPPVAAPVAPPVRSPIPTGPTRGRGGTPRGRGRGRGFHQSVPPRQSPQTSSPGAVSSPSSSVLQESRHAPSSLSASIHAPKPAQSTPSTAASATSAATSTTSTTDNATAPASTISTASATAIPASAVAPPTGPSAPAPPKSVRGDRSSTGGTSRPKLSEEELSARLASAKLRNATLEAAHARAQADAASFAAREDQAARRRTEERKDRAAMMGEREKNRLRKLKAQGGREWDSEKIEGEEQGRSIRGANGGITGQRTTGGGGEKEEPGWEKEYMFQEKRGGGRGRGSGQARGGGSTQVPRGEEFPALAPGKTEAPTWNVQKEKESPVVALKADTDKGKSWADMVEDVKEE